MTHKYLSQIRTIPNYHDDQSEFARILRKAKYTFKTASNMIIKNKKTRIITSVLAIYMLLTSGFVVAFVNVDNNKANAQLFAPVSSLEITVTKQKVEADNIEVKLEVQNKTNQSIARPMLQLQSSLDNIKWNLAYNNINSNNIDLSSSGFRLDNIGPSQKTSYNLYGKLTNPNIDNIAIQTNVTYKSENQAYQTINPKFLIDLR